jgi:hypothetical protein
MRCSARSALATSACIFRPATRWHGAGSDRFLRYAADLVRERGGAVAAVDVTIVCERPRIGPHRAAMGERVAAILGIAPGRVSIKATTTEKLGFTGRAEGIAAQAVATVRLPSDIYRRRRLARPSGIRSLLALGPGRLPALCREPGDHSLLPCFLPICAGLSPGPRYCRDHLRRGLLVRCEDRKAAPSRIRARS